MYLHLPWYLDGTLRYHPMNARFVLIATFTMNSKLIQAISWYYNTYNTTSLWSLRVENKSKKLIKKEINTLFNKGALN